MNERRRPILFGILALIIAYYAGEWLYSTVLDGPRTKLESRKAQIEKRIKERKSQLTEALKAGRQLEIWESQSLPSDPEVAVSYYRQWLTELVEYVKFDKAKVDPGNPMNRKGMYYSTECSIRATCTLQQLTTFLYEFYNAGHLHLIHSISITPLSQRKEVDVAISVEALILPSADREDELTTVKADRLALAGLADYQVITDRNLFGHTSRGMSQTDQTFLTAVVRVDDLPQAWFTDRSMDRVLKLASGDSLAIGQFLGTVQEIAGHDVIVESDGERWLMTVGESFAQALACRRNSDLDDPQTSLPDKPAVVLGELLRLHVLGALARFSGC